MTTLDSQSDTGPLPTNVHNMHNIESPSPTNIRCILSHYVRSLHLASTTTSTDTSSFSQSLSDCSIFYVDWYGWANTWEAIWAQVWLLKGHTGPSNRQNAHVFTLWPTGGYCIPYYTYVSSVMGVFLSCNFCISGFDVFVSYFGF